jgi:hypothetical protein
MRFGWTPPPPDYPEYAALLAAAQQGSPFVDPARVWEPQHIADRRGWDWATAVLGRPFNGLRSISHTEARLIELADAAGVTPPLPDWLLAERAESAAAAAELDRRRAEARQRDLDTWTAARDACPVPLEVRENTHTRVRGYLSEALRHAVPTADAVSGTRRQHPAGRALCVTAGRRPLNLSDPVDQPATCVRCLDWTSKIRPATPTREHP